MEPVSRTGVNPYNVDIKCEVPGLCYDFSAETKWLNNKFSAIDGGAMGVDL